MNKIKEFLRSRGGKAVMTIVYIAAGYSIGLVDIDSAMGLLKSLVGG